MTEKMNPTAKNNTTTGSTLNPCASSVNNFIMVAEDPPAPAALAESGIADCDCAFLSAAVFLLAALLNPPGAWTDEDDYNLISIILLHSKNIPIFILKDSPFYFILSLKER